MREVRLGIGSVWLGDSVCLYYPMGKKRKAPPVSMLEVLARDLRYKTSMRDETAGGNKIGARSGMKGRPLRLSDTLGSCRGFWPV